MLNRPLFGKHVASRSSSCKVQRCNNFFVTDEHFAPENGWLEDVCRSFWGIFGLFSGAKLLLVSGSVTWNLKDQPFPVTSRAKGTWRTPKDHHITRKQIQQQQHLSLCPSCLLSKKTPPLYNTTRKTQSKKGTLSSNLIKFSFNWIRI